MTIEDLRSTVNGDARARRSKSERKTRKRMSKRMRMTTGMSKWKRKNS